LTRQRKIHVSTLLNKGYHRRDRKVDILNLYGYERIELKAYPGGFRIVFTSIPGVIEGDTIWAERARSYASLYEESSSMRSKQLAQQPQICLLPSSPVVNPNFKGFLATLGERWAYREHFVTKVNSGSAYEKHISSSFHQDWPGTERSPGWGYAWERALESG